MERLQVVCDGCTIVKRETNHWWSVYTGEVDGFTYPHPRPAAPLLTVVPYGVGVGAVDGGSYRKREDFCGAECLQRAIAAFISGVNMTPTPAAKELDR